MTMPIAKLMPAAMKKEKVQIHSINCLNEKKEDLFRKKYKSYELF